MSEKIFYRFFSVCFMLGGFYGIVGGSMKTPMVMVWSLVYIFLSILYYRASR